MRVESFLIDSNAISRELVALSKVVLAVLTDWSAFLALVFFVLRPTIFSKSFEGLKADPKAVQREINSSKFATFVECPVSDVLTIFFSFCGYVS